MRRAALVLLAAGLAWVGSTPAARDTDTGGLLYQKLKIRPGNVLVGTVLTARVLPGEDRQVVSVITWFTGKRDEAHAVNVRLDVHARRGNELLPLYSRDFGAEFGGHVARGELLLVDLDGDGVNEIVVSYDHLKDPLVFRRQAHVIVREDGAFREAWVGDLEYDATRSARGVPLERRDRFQRELNIPETLRTRGASMVFDKTMLAVAGERLTEPRVSREVFPLRSR
jgi:hypothetical protein